MARPKKKYHIPGKQCRSGRWRIYWRGPDGKYEMSIGQADKATAERKRLQVELAIRTAEWPSWALGAPAVGRFRRKVSSSPDDLLGLYERDLRADVSDLWATNNMQYLRQWSDWLDGSLDQADQKDARSWITHVRQVRGPRGKTRSVATRNRMLGAARRFYHWAEQAGYVPENPFAGIAKLMEPRPADITYCTRTERDWLLKAARAEARGLAVWIAFYAGLRRSEIWRLRWADVSLERWRLTVQPGKTGRPRVIPLASHLEDVLTRAVGNKEAHVVPRRHDWTWEADLLVSQLREACPEIPNERIRWNAWRHTFGSLLAQDGVSLDKISAWMGNSAEVCRRHYTQFVPRDRHDEDIERL